MILLDTNYLIRALVRGTSEAERVVAWYRSGEELCTASVAWYEFLCGPVNDEAVMIVGNLIADRIVPFTAAQAAESARLYEATGRKRSLRVDAMIAAAAIVSGAALATGNLADFAAFEPFGLRIAKRA